MELRGRRRGRAEVEPEARPVVVDIVEDDDLAVAHQGHAPGGGARARRRRVVVRRLVAL